MQALGTCGPDIHCRTFSDWIKALEDLDRTGVITQGRTVPARASEGLWIFNHGIESGDPKP